MSIITEKEWDQNLRQYLEEQFKIEGWSVKINRDDGIIHAIVFAIREILKCQGK